MRLPQEEMDDLAEAWRERGDERALLKLLDELMPYVGTIISRRRRAATRDQREELDAEARVLVIEYLANGGEPVAAKVGSMIKGRLLALTERDVHMTEGEQRVSRLAFAVDREARDLGRAMGTTELIADLQRRCDRWALAKCDGDVEAAAAKLSRRGITRALRDVPGLLAAAQRRSLDAPIGEDGATLADLLVAPESGLGEDLQITEESERRLARVLAHLTDNEREAVLWMCKLSGDPKATRGEIAEATGVPVRRLAPLLRQVAERVEVPYLRFALFDPHVPSAFFSLSDDAVDDVLALARTGSSPA